MIDFLALVGMMALVIGAIVFDVWRNDKAEGVRIAAGAWLGLGIFAGFCVTSVVVSWLFVHGIEGVYNHPIVAIAVVAAYAAIVAFVGVRRRRRLVSR